MSQTKRKFIILLLFSCCVLIIFVLKIAGGLSAVGMRAGEVGIPHVWTKENEKIHSSITQVLETEDALYLVYGYQSIIQAYSLDGAYLYSVCVYNYNNGRTEIAYSKSKDVLYISDKRHNIYTFSGENFLE